MVFDYLIMCKKLLYYHTSTTNATIIDSSTFTLHDILPCTLLVFAAVVVLLVFVFVFVEYCLDAWLVARSQAGSQSKRASH